MALFHLVIVQFVLIRFFFYVNVKIFFSSGLCGSYAYMQFGSLLVAIRRDNPRVS